MQVFDGAWLSRPCSDELHAALPEFTGRHGVTLYMTLLAAFAAVLARYSGQHDLVIAPLPMRLALIAGVVLILYTGVFPASTLEFARQSVQGLGALGGGMLGMVP